MIRKLTGLGAPWRVVGNSEGQAKHTTHKIMKLSRWILGITLVLGASSASAADLLHQYSFNNGTANDSVGGANGTLMGTTSVSGGQLVLPGGNNASGNYLNLPAATIGINTYSGVTLEMWSTQPAINQGFSMTATFGGTWGNGLGQNYLMISTTRGDDVSRGAIAITADDVEPWLDEVFVNGAEMNDALEHYYAVTINGTQLAYYIDGVLQGTAAVAPSALSSLSTQSAFLGRGVYNGDAMVQGSINEFRIWNAALPASEIALHNVLGANVVPEPSAFALVGFGMASLVVLRRRA